MEICIQDLCAISGITIVPITTLILIMWRSINHELKEIRKEANANKEELRKEANANKEELRKEANANKEELRKEIHSVDRRLIRLEDRLEFSNKIVYLQHDNIKEN